jgi:thiamine-monophosphate kinase
MPLGEFELIGRFFQRAPPDGAAAACGADPGVELGIGDDAALLRMPAGEDLVAAVDAIVEGRHFPVGTAPRSIGHRALAVNLSDIAAMGAAPRWALLSLTIPAADPAWLEEFAGGFHALADAQGVALVGGDTTAGPLNVCIQILGSVPRGTALRRSGAAAGDLVVVTGSLGDAAAGLAVVQSGAPGWQDSAAARELVRRFDFPEPRVRLGIAARGLASAAMDLSDGLSGDLPKLAVASGLAAAVAVERLPLSAALREWVALPQARELALSGGDDYELLFCVPPQRYQALADAASDCGVPLTVIGEMRHGAGVTWLLQGSPVNPAQQGFDHFR